MKAIKEILEIVVIVSLFCIVAIAAFTLFAVGYFWSECVFMSWYQEVFSPWIVEQIRIIFLHPENFCFALGMLVFIWIPIVMGIVLLIGSIVKWVKKTLARKI